MRMIDADAFLKRNEEYADCEFIHPKYQNTLREIVDDEPTIHAPRWHRVEEPPKEYGNYLAVVNGEVMEVTYSDISMRDDWNWSTCDAEGFVWIRSESVTHWMPLPEPPKEDA